MEWGYFNKLRGNIILQFTIVTFIVVFAVSLLLIFILSREMTDQALRVHINLYPKLVEQMVKDTPQIISFLESEPNHQLTEEISRFIDDLKSFGFIFRVKIWNADGTILASDKKEIIGKNYKDNPQFQRAREGVVSYQRGQPYRSEHATEINRGTILEIYVPVQAAGKSLGVIELYEAADELFSGIQKNNDYIQTLVLMAGCIIYLLLFYIFLMAHRRQKVANERLMHTQDAIISTLAHQAELRDVETGGHLDRTSMYVGILSQELLKFSPYRVQLTGTFINDLTRSAPLHDIGKVGVPDAILCKPGKLTKEEFLEMKKHCEFGARILREAEKRLGFPSFLIMAVEIALYHHERWDGDGYPSNLAGGDIPLAARMIALADVYDALRSERHYKKALSHERSVEIIAKEKGSQFDPFVAEAFLRKEKDFERISLELAD
ncbi:MAG: HD domain-containing protein [Candidatus Tectomicrobia bacterium]|uniref:HD domain-containing protein n=1 Tax=Tectimicrobiota bacterium TaxID=2528274 RepID=A0A933GKC9_UNCTE|nr:HD domain-containing protein [Candidatus Tectomicrobia bacterium]